MVAREMEVLLEVGGFDMDGGVGTMNQAHIDVQKCDIRGGCVPKLDEITAVEVSRNWEEKEGKCHQ